MSLSNLATERKEIQLQLIKRKTKLSRLIANEKQVIANESEIFFRQAVNLIEYEINELKKRSKEIIEQAAQAVEVAETKKLDDNQIFIEELNKHIANSKTSFSAKGIANFVIGGESLVYRKSLIITMLEKDGKITRLENAIKGIQNKFEEVFNEGVEKIPAE